MKSSLFAAAALAIAVFVFSCENSPYPGYTEVEKGIWYKLHYPGETEKKAGQEDVYEVKMTNSFGGTVFYDSELETPEGTLFMQSSASRYFSVLGEGDSATFLLPGGDLKLPGTPDTGMIQMNVKIVKIYTQDEFAKLNRITDQQAGEMARIQRYCRKNKLNLTTDQDGLYYTDVLQGKGAKPDTGGVISIHYKGYFMNGRVFDDTYERKEPLKFNWKEEGQVIPGFKLALRKMKEGGKAKIILPSHLAFGQGGSSTGIVPPNTPVIYELELLKIE
ncbi:MAG: hypothetical protein Fur0041_20970 [Bacteroidia bacterium]